MEPLADRITSELRTLVGQQLGDCGRAANMQVFGFGPRLPTRSRQGEFVEVSGIRLHIQCRWRFVDGRSILFGRDDLSYPANESTPLEEFDWDKADSVLDIAQRRWFEEDRTTPPMVREVQGDAYGGFRIELAGGYALECFPCDSRRGEYSEHWRLFGHRADGSHFVVCGDGVLR